MVGGAFWGTRVMEIVKKHDSGGKLWKRVKLTTTRKANAKKRTLRVWQMMLKASPPGKDVEITLFYGPVFLLSKG
ncbi:hypothetical protein RJ640_030901 [Escallonia rubra]|uniref:Uncharacterized protein n=1 Tax=Escallonia rubra TaxID=112253 RepID=A0AA88RXC3_9ASTE|nr:hypothetical protein RJ640_030901 [Escallonia rubra]